MASSMPLTKSNTNTTSVTEAVSTPNKKKRLRTKSVMFNDNFQPTGEILGTGAHASVETYIDLATDKEYAVKIIDVSNPQVRSKVFKEIEIYTLCSGHPNILELKEFYEENQKFYLVFPKMCGGSLFDVICSRGKFTEAEASSVMKQLASGVNHLHSKGIAHRDLKPENCLCEFAGSLKEVRICDFDLGFGASSSNSSTMQHAKFPPKSVVTPTLLTPVGSAEFMAPEVVDAWVTDDATPYDKKCDLWSLGVMLYILLCGYPPFYGSCGEADCGWEEGNYCKDCQLALFHHIQTGELEFPEQEWGAISDDAKNLIEKLLERDPCKRYSATQVLEHDWISGCVPSTLLHTPSTLLRRDSVMNNYVEQANAVNRRTSYHLSLDARLTAALTAAGKDPSAPAKFRIGGDDETDDDCDEDEAADDLDLDHFDYDQSFGSRPVSKVNSMSSESSSSTNSDDSTGPVVGTVTEQSILKEAMERQNASQQTADVASRPPVNQPLSFVIPRTPENRTSVFKKQTKKLSAAPPTTCSSAQGLVIMQNTANLVHRALASSAMRRCVSMPLIAIKN